MKCYLAASWSRREEISKVADALRELGVEVTSRWLLPPANRPKTGLAKFHRQRAMEDVEDVKASEILVRFTDDLSATMVPAKLATGSRMFEMGLAWAMGKPIIVVGGHQPIFDHLVNITHLKTTGELLRYLSPTEIN